MQGRRHDYQVNPTELQVTKLKALALFLGEKGHTILDVAPPLRRHDSDFIALKESGTIKVTLFRATTQKTIEVRSYESKTAARDVLSSLSESVRDDLRPFKIGRVLPIKFIQKDWRKLIEGPIV